MDSGRRWGRGRCLDDEATTRFAEPGWIDAAAAATIGRHAEECTDCARKIEELLRKHEDPMRPHPLASVMATSAARLGDVLVGKYVVDGMLGAGGMGTVVRARHLELGSKVAIKLMRPSRLEDRDSVRRFLREGRAAAALQSMHSARIMDIDRLPNGTPFIVMEYLEGRNLARVVAKEGRFTPRRTVHVALQILEALGEAHAAGIVHRDLKPQNVLLTKDDVVKVVDFGLAKAVFDGTDADGATKTNALLGSPRYMAPEQIASAKSVDARADLWSLGATMYHLLVGLPPFVNPNIYVLTNEILNRDAPRVREIRHDVPQDLDDIIARCLARSRELRYASAKELAGALRDLVLPRDEAGEVGRAVPIAADDDPEDSTEQMDVPAPGREEASITTDLADVDVDPTRLNGDDIPRLFDDLEEPREGKGGTLLMVPGFVQAAATGKGPRQPAPPPPPTRAQPGISLKRALVIGVALAACVFLTLELLADC